MLITTKAAPHVWWLALVAIHNNNIQVSTTPDRPLPTAQRTERCPCKCKQPSRTATSAGPLNNLSPSSQAQRKQFFSKCATFSEASPVAEAAEVAPIQLDMADPEAVRRAPPTSVIGPSEQRIQVRTRRLRRRGKRQRQRHWRPPTQPLGPKPLG